MTSPAFRTVRVPSRAHTPGPVFVLLHGIGLSHREFTRLARHLSGAGEVISFDLPGFGPTPRPQQQLTVHDHAAIVSAELERMNVGPAVVVGHSMGAQFALELARLNPGAVDRVVLIGPVVDAKKPTLTAQAIALLLDSPLEPPATQAMVMFDYLRCGVRWFLTEAVEMRDYDTHLAIRDVAHPVLVIRGGKDPIADAPWCESLVAGVPNRRVATIAGYRHNVVHSNAAATADAILSFMAEPLLRQQGQLGDHPRMGENPEVASRV